MSDFPALTQFTRFSGCGAKLGPRVLEQALCGLEQPAYAELLAAVQWLTAAGIEPVRKREAALTDRLLRGLLALPGVAAPGPGPGVPRAPVVSITIRGRDLGELALELDRRDIAARVGLHCAPQAHRSIGTLEGGGTLRFSPGYFNTEAEIDRVLGAMEALLA